MCYIVELKVVSLRRLLETPSHPLPLLLIYDPCDILVS